MDDTLFITWFSHRRTTELAKYFNIPLVELISSFRGLRRYVELSRRTWCLIREKQPKVLFVQNPSVILALEALLLKYLFRYRLVVDAHNEAVEPFSHSFTLMRLLASVLLSCADRTIVTNKQLAEIVTNKRGAPLVLPDRIPDVPEKIQFLNLSPAFNVAVIATFAKDEPIEQIIAAANAIGSECHFYVTGRIKRRYEYLLSASPENVTYCGYLSDPEYWGLLKRCDVVIDLTLKDNCLVCGAYEALAVGTPMILSANPACKELFNGVAIFTENNVESIVLCLTDKMLRSGQLRDQIKKLKHEFENKWLDYALEVRMNIEKLSSC